MVRCDPIEARPAILAGISSAFVDVELALGPLPSWRADTLYGIDAVDTRRAIQARERRAFIDVDFAQGAYKSLDTLALDGIHAGYARRAIQAQALVAQIVEWTDTSSRAHVHALKLDLEIRRVAKQIGNDDRRRARGRKDKVFVKV